MLTHAQKFTSFSATTNEPHGSLKRISKLSVEEISKRDVFGRTVLHHIVIQNRYDLLNKILKNKNLDLTATEWENGWNCMHLAMFYRHFLVVRILMQCPEKETLLAEKDRDGWTPVDILMSYAGPRNMLRFPSCVSVTDEVGTTAGLPLKETKLVNTRVIDRSGTLDSRWRKIVMKKLSAERARARELRNRERMIRRNERRARAAEEGMQEMADQPISEDEESDTESSVVNPEEVPDANFQFDRLIKGRTNLFFRGPLAKTSGVLLEPKSKPAAPHEKFAYPRIVHLCVGQKVTFILTDELTGNIYVSNHTDSQNLDIKQFARIEEFNDEKIVNVHIVAEHAVCVTAENSVFTWGSSNEYGQLGDRLTRIKRGTVITELPLEVSEPVLGVCSSRIHTMVYTKSSISSFGLNIGQAGKCVETIHGSKGKQEVYADRTGLIVRNHKLVPPGCISSVVCNEFFTLVLSVDNLLTGYANNFFFSVEQTIPKFSRRTFDTFAPTSKTKQANIKKIVTTSGSSQALVIYESGDVSILTLPLDCTDKTTFNSKIKLTSAWRASKDHMKCMDANLGTDGSIILCLSDGSAYRGIKRQQAGRDSKLHSVVTKTYKYTKEVGVAHTVAVSCDPAYKNFAYLKEDVRMLPMQLRKSLVLSDFSRCSPHVYTERPEKWSLAERGIDFVYGLSDNTLDDQETESTHFSGKILSFTNSWKRTVRQPSDNILDMDTIQRLGWPQLVKTDSMLSDTNIVVVGKSGAKDVWIPAHKLVLCSRSKVLARVILEGKPLNKSNISISYDGDSNCINFEGSNVDARAVFLLIHYLYTDEYLKYPAELSEDLSRSRRMFSILANVVLTLMPPLEGHIWSDIPELHDTRVILADGQLKCHSIHLGARSPYFEALFSRWKNNEEKVVRLPDISKSVFAKVLRYCAGYHAFEIFVDPVDDIAEFVELAVDVIEAADEFLLPELSELCQLVLKDLISLENVLSLTLAAYESRATPLFINCLWFIYNNLDIMLFNGDFDELIKISAYDRNLVTQIDLGLQWFGGLNTQVNAQKKSEDSREYINCFLEDLGKFNKNFVDGADSVCFHRLDKMVVVPEKKRRSSSMKQSRQPSPTFSSEMSASSSLRSNEFAVDTDDSTSASEFIPVMNRRRMSRKSSSTNTPRTEVLKTAIKPSSVGTPVKAISLPVSEISRLSVSPSSTSPLSTPSKTPPKKTKISMPKLSQKERMKQRQSPLPSSPATPVKPLYTIPTSTSKSFENVPSFESIRLQEQLKNVVVETPVASLEDIKREEEFARWWAQESKRVQAQMQAAEAQQSGQNRRNSNHRRRSKTGNQNNGTRRPSKGDPSA